MARLRLREPKLCGTEHLGAPFSLFENIRHYDANRHMELGIKRRWLRTLRSSESRPDVCSFPGGLSSIQGPDLPRVEKRRCLAQHRRNGFGQQTPDRSFVAASGASGMPRSHEGALSGSLGAAISIRASDGLAGNAKWPAKRPSHGTSSERATKPQRGLPSLPSSARRQTLEQPAKKSLPVRDATLPRAPRCTRSVVCTYEADRLAKDPHLKSVMHAPRYSPASYGFPRPHATRACPENLELSPASCLQSRSCGL
ncbi:hypothetical protein CCUS01_07532 [Colletotrichum cuscutae]|uniref:Uncharacterized protein n=1 Tax=Colletotrichum cuscutae TaxID=1209917 RepID=A0AAI9UV93_9PEZI|nr:hypothetical protein CCUS01_07532 [Colletotrichum cuscutae]